jgi:hypothetical protein
VYQYNYDVVDVNICGIRTFNELKKQNWNQNRKKTKFRREKREKKKKMWKQKQYKK